MRAHRLEITAFGPFADTEVVDFDALSADGLFLLHGPTGAGKTSVLDALCFGLYGEVPGDRQSARDLHSDHADPEVAPRVVVECTLAGRRFKITRSPRWTRPKRRGVGDRTIQPSVTLEEQVGEEWVHRSSRLDETGHLLGSLIGLTASQFTQVVLLPQGRFSTFLRDGGESRRALLEQIFDTGRFTRVERWLAEQRTAWRERARRHHDEVAQIVQRIAEAADTALPEDWDALALDDEAASGALTTWATALRVGVADAADRARTACADARAVTESLVAEVEAAEQAAVRWERLCAALSRQRALDERAEEMAAARTRLHAARRAAAVVPLVEARDRAQRDLRRASHAADEALASVHSVLEEGLPLSAELGLGDDHLAALGSATEAALARRSLAESLLPREQELSGARRLADEQTRLLEAARSALATAAQHHAGLPARRAEIQAELQARADAAGRLSALEVRLHQAADHRAGAEEAADCRPRLEEAHSVAAAAAVDVAAAREAWLDARERRIDGMAAELASRLAVGACCPVCGSAEHPHPAQPASTGLPSDLEEAARTRYDDAVIAHQVATQEVAALTASLRAAEARAAGHDVETARATQVALEGDVEAARAAGDRQVAAAEALALLDAEAATSASELERLRADVATLSVREAEGRARVTELVLTLGEALGEHATAGEAIRAGETAVRVLRAAQDASRALASARESAEAARARAEEAAAAAGFDDAEAVSAAALDEATCADLDAALTAEAAESASVATILADPSLRDLVGRDPAPAPPDPDDLARRRGRRDDALAAQQALEVGLELMSRRLERLDRLVDQLTSALGRWAPVRDHWHVLRDLTALCEGKGPDNAHQMRLSAYVLAARLAQVVAAANVRLVAMTDGRYELRHTSASDAGDRRGGLGLRVDDGWTGDQRDPATLSGGETFIVSLALALGLADVVAHEAGAMDFETLFVDEGFGSLDADSLDRVLDTLDGLREGGRVVGVVSHVPEMRDRIPRQLRVDASERGSRVVMVAPLGSGS